MKPSGYYLVANICFASAVCSAAYNLYAVYSTHDWEIGAIGWIAVGAFSVTSLVINIKNYIRAKEEEKT